MKIKKSKEIEEKDKRKLKHIFEQIQYKTSSLTMMLDTLFMCLEILHATGSSEASYDAFPNHFFATS